ncbi:MAG: putative dsRNA-binding protein, partial [Microvirgula sp.]
AAVSVAAGFAAAEGVVRRLYASRIAGIDLNRQAKDAKTHLQEVLQARRLPLPAYRIVNQTGDAHLSHFDVACDIPALGIASRGEGASRRAAEQLAAERALDLIAAHDDAAKPRHKL